jgi:hypothetical protein
VVNNIAGMGVSTGKMDLILQWLNNTNVDIFIGQEANVSFDIPRSSLISEGKKHFSQTHIASSEIELYISNHINQGEGGFCISIQQIRSRITRRIHNQGGRWSGTVYQWIEGVKPATISIFQVCNKAAKGTTSVHSQQNARPQKLGRTEDPRKALHIDITENMLIIIGGNFNDSDKSKGLH